MKITYFNKREREKRVRGVILSQKLTLNHPSLVDEREKKNYSFDDGLPDRKGKERKNFFFLF